MSDLAAFLLARYSEDEAIARAADEHMSHWHIDRWQPSAVLADIAAKRKIVAHHREYRYTDVSQGIRDSPACTICCGVASDVDIDADVVPFLPAVYPCRTVRLLAEPYSGHPDYQPEWQPQTEEN